MLVLPTLFHGFFSSMINRNRELTTSFLSFGAIVLVSFALYLKNNRFFYIDDKVAEYIPKLLDIARIIKGGEFPLLSTNLMNGGIYSAEYAEGIYNPIILGSSLLLDLFDDLALGSCVLTIVFQLIAFGGYYLLAVELGIRSGWAKIFALSVVLNCFFVYWYTTAWFNPVNGTAFLPYALWSSLVLARSITLKTTTTFLISCFMTVSAGWPSTLLVMFGFLVLVLLDILLIEKDTRKFIANFLVYSGVGLVCSIPILPLIFSNEMFTRVSSTQNTSNFLAGTLKGLFMFSFPSFKGFMHSWGGYEKLSFNTYYAAWYALPLLTMVNFKMIDIWKKYIWILLVFTIVGGISILGPEHFGPLRFPIRMLQYYHIFGLLLIMVLLETYGPSITKKRLFVSLSLFLFQAVLAFQVSPASIDTIFAYLILMVVLTISTFYIIKRKDGLKEAEFFILITTVLVLLSIYADEHHGRGTDWNVPSVRSAYSSLNKDDGYILYNGGYLETQEQHSEFRPSTIGLIWNDKIINGYSPLGNKFFREKIPISDHGNISSWEMKRKGEEFFETDAATGLELLELMKVSRIISFKNELGTNILEAVSDKWSFKEKKHTFVFDHQPYEFPGHISWIDEGIEVLKVEKLKHSTEQYSVRNSNPSQGRIVFARLWWPGYQATMNGKEIAIERYSGFLISVLVPGNSLGTMSLTFTPPGFYFAWPLSFIGLALVLLMGILFSRNKNELSGLRECNDQNEAI